jgi:hypothetical protein
MKKKLDIPKDFWKDFKDRKDFDDFFSDLFKEGITQMLKAEMTDHLGYEKYSKEGDNSGNSRNGDYTKTLITNLDEITVNVPQDRNGEIDPKVVPKHESRFSDDIAEVIIGLYSRGMSTTDIQEQIEQIYGDRSIPAACPISPIHLWSPFRSGRIVPLRKSTMWFGWTVSPVSLISTSGTRRCSETLH